MSAVESTVSNRKSEMQQVLENQKAAYLEEGHVSLNSRIDRLDRAIAAIAKNKRAIIEALSSDFGSRCIVHTKMSDVEGSISPLKDARKNVSKWMKAEKRKPLFPLGLLGARARIEYQPLGVVGIISPWNFPFNLTFAPLAGALAAGNRAMIKPSEFTPATSELMNALITEAFDVNEIAVFTGGPEVGEAFSNLAFDHLIFTGATSVAKYVLHGAADNLVPVTLELGGKSPVILGRSAPLEAAADRILLGKTMNAGQICLAPDYIFAPEESKDELVRHLKELASKMYPTIKDNNDFTSVINDKHYKRLITLVEDAREKGAEIIQVNPAEEDFSNQAHHKIPLTIVLNATEDMKIMQDEIFGPLLPIKTYKEVGDAIDYINAHPRPLGLYYFGRDKAEERKVLDKTTSGGVTINDVVMHVAQEDLPFGGVGPSGMGSYHGYHGFKTFSHARSVFTQTKLDVASLAGLRAPFGKK